jgi:hypothetical protein
MMRIAQKNWMKVLPVFGTLAMLTGCAATALRPGAERIIVTKKDAPKGCKFLGAVVGEQGGSFSGGLTSNRNLAQGAWNDIRNKAYDLGANFVQLETERAGVTGSGYGSTSPYSGYSSSSHSAQTDVTMTGNAYRCNPADIGLE